MQYVHHLSMNQNFNPFIYQEGQQQCRQPLRHSVKTPFNQTLTLTSQLITDFYSHLNNQSVPNPAKQTGSQELGQQETPCPQEICLCI